MERNLHRLRVVVETGDLAAVEADAVVNAANDHLWMGSGVAGALKRAGGSAIEREALALGPIPVGEAVITGAGTLPARRVIHAAAMGQDLATDENLVRRATLNALRRAEEAGLADVAFPALGTGVGGLGFPECARAMISAVAERAAAGTSVQVVRFVLFGEAAEAAFKKVLAEADEGDTG
jgi:O-acetyl-ADP-ribose deacetylase (regulator of RNase III)